MLFYTFGVDLPVKFLGSLSQWWQSSPPSELCLGEVLLPGCLFSPAITYT